MTKLWRDSVDKKFIKIDKNFDEIKKKQSYVEKRFNEIKQWRGKVDKTFVKIDKRFDKIDKTFVKIDKRFDKIEYQLDEVTNIAISNQYEIKHNLATKKDLSELNDRMVKGFDDVLGVVRKIDQEQVFMGNRINRIEQKVGI